MVETRQLSAKEIDEIFFRNLTEYAEMVEREVADGLGVAASGVRELPPAIVRMAAFEVLRDANIVLGIDANDLPSISLNRYVSRLFDKVVERGKVSISTHGGGVGTELTVILSSAQLPDNGAATPGLNETVMIGHEHGLEPTLIRGTADGGLAVTGPLDPVGRGDGTDLEVTIVDDGSDFDVTRAMRPPFGGQFPSLVGPVDPTLQFSGREGGSPLGWVDGEPTLAFTPAESTLHDGGGAGALAAPLEVTRTGGELDGPTVMGISVGDRAAPLPLTKPVDSPDLRRSRGLGHEGGVGDSTHPSLAEAVDGILSVADHRVPPHLDPRRRAVTRDGERRFLRVVLCGVVLSVCAAVFYLVPSVREAVCETISDHVRRRIGVSYGADFRSVCLPGKEDAEY